MSRRPAARPPPCRFPLTPCRDRRHTGHHANATYRHALHDARHYFTGALKTEIAELDTRGATIGAYVNFELDKISRVQESRSVGPTRGVSPEIFPPDEPGTHVEDLPSRALVHLHKRPSVVEVDGKDCVKKGVPLPQFTVIEQRCLL